MKKSILEPVIKKYYLSNLMELSGWKVASDNKLKVLSVLPNKVIVTNIEVSNFTDFKDVKFCINDTTRLLKMLNALDEDITITVGGNNDTITCMTLKSEDVEVQCATIDVKIVNEGKLLEVPKLINNIVFSTEVVVDKDFISTFTSANSAHSDCENVVFKMSSDNKLQLIFGQRDGLNKSLNTSQIKYFPKTTDGKNVLTKTVKYNAGYLKEIFLANKEADDTVFKIAENGLGQIAFKNGDIVATYTIMGIVE